MPLWLLHLRDHTALKSNETPPPHHDPEWPTTRYELIQHRVHSPPVISHSIKPSFGPQTQRQEPWWRDGKPCRRNPSHLSLLHPRCPIHSLTPTDDAPRGFNVLKYLPMRKAPSANTQGSPQDPDIISKPRYTLSEEVSMSNRIPLPQTRPARRCGTILLKESTPPAHVP